MCQVDPVNLSWISHGVFVNLPRTGVLGNALLGEAGGINPFLLFSALVQ